MKIDNLPIIGNYVKRMIVNVDKYGIQEAIRREIERSGSKLLVYDLNKETKEILKTRGIIIACNHPHEIETLALIASLPSRKDCFLIANAGLMGLSKSLDRNLIPVYIRHHYGNGKTSFLIRLSGKIIEKFHYSPNYSPEEEHRKNIQSIKIGAEKVKRGSTVIIFPERHGEGARWYPGIGWLIRNTGPLKKGYYIKVYVGETSSLDYLRLIPQIGKILPTIKVYFGKPQKIVDIYEDDPKQLTTKLEKEYNTWIGSLR